MKRTNLFGIFFLVLTISATPLLWSCGNDDDEQGSPDANTNANLFADGPEAARLEIPRLKGGVVNMFLVKRVPTFGINYCVEWDIAKKAQRWTAFRWDSSNSVRHTSRADEPFAEDTQIPAEYRTYLSQYAGSGYTRGHICASADRLCSNEANVQTFLLSNMHPQYWNFNGGIWLSLENKIRTWNNNNFRDTLYVVKGGTIDHQSDIIERTSSGLIVPKYFFMALLCKNKSNVNEGYKAIGFYLEHKREAYADEENVAPYIVSIDKLEDLTGIDFFCNLPDRIEQQVEKNVTPSAWGFQ